MHSRQRSSSSRAFFCPTMRAMCALPYPPSKLPTLGPVWPARPKEGGGGWRRWLTRRRARPAEAVAGVPGDPVALTLPTGVSSRTGLASAPWGGAGASSGTSDQAVLTEDGVIRRNRQVGHHVQDMSAADGVARDHCDNGLRAAAHLHLEVQNLQPWRRLGAIIVAAIATDGLVSASAEGVRPVARQDNNAHLHVVPRDRERARQLVHRDWTERVVHPRSADRDLRNSLGRDRVPHVLQPQGRGAVVPDHLSIRDGCKIVAIDARCGRRPPRHARDRGARRNRGAKRVLSHVSLSGRDGGGRRGSKSYIIFLTRY